MPNSDWKEDIGERVPDVSTTERAFFSRAKKAIPGLRHQKFKEYSQPVVLLLLKYPSRSLKKRKKKYK